MPIQVKAKSYEESYVKKTRTFRYILNKHIGQLLAIGERGSVFMSVISKFAHIMCFTATHHC
jgi:hypothetical protein